MGTRIRMNIRLIGDYSVFVFFRITKYNYMSRFRVQ